MNTKNIHEIYKCSVCGNVVEVLTVGGGELVCCGKPMDLLEEKTSADEQGVAEKHVPVIEELPANVCQGKDGVIIKIGATEHPMEENHYIEWIEVITKNGACRTYLKPNDNPEIEACKCAFEEKLTIRTYCNVHGLWKTEI